MLATLTTALPTDPDDYSFEFKWDGVRAIIYWDGRELRIRSRNNNDITRRYPELEELGEALDERRAILDGEIVALDENDQPSFPLLQRRMHVEGADVVQRLAREVPVYYVIFDLLWTDGRSVMDQPLHRRREMLEQLTLAGPSWRVSPAMVGEGEAMRATAMRHRLEGIIAKKLDSTYQPGRRSPDWRKIKLVMRQEFVVGGWTSEQGSPRMIGALHVGYYDAGANGKGPRGLRYAGSVGTGFKAADLVALSKQFMRLRTTRNPFVDPLPRRDVNFVEPKMVVEVEYRRWPAGGSIQQASFKGVRTDKRAAQVVREDPRCSI
jgi:bifunctional non-homologous end joining protein LigD